MWDVRNNSERVGRIEAGQIHCLAKVEGATQPLLISGGNHSVGVWSVEPNGISATCIQTVEQVHRGPITGLAPITKSKFFSAGIDGSVHLCDWEASGGSLHRFDAHTEPIHGVRYNGRDRLITFGQEKHWKMWKFTQDMHPIDLKTKLV